MRRDKALQYMKLAQHMADTFSKDPRRKVSAIYLAPDSFEILTAGFNGFPRGVDETNPSRWERPAKYGYIIHAEANGICNACRNGTPLKDSIAVVTMFPCAGCAKSLIQAGIRTVVSREPDLTSQRWGDEFKLSLEMFQEVGMRLVLFREEEL
jgi:dCMP deaminase